MDKLKYIPGDLVTIETESTKPRLVKVSNVDEDSVIYCEGWGEVCFYDEIKPIPLTKDILLRNGWKNDDYDWYRLPTKRAYLYITKDITTLGEFLVCVGLDRHNLASINFVHQLQHILFALNISHEIKV